MSRRPDLWEEMYKRFDPFKSARHSPWRAGRPHSPRNRILERLRTPFGDKRFLLYGTVGTGKTTELWAIAEQQRRDSMVVFFDVRRFFDKILRDTTALDHIQPWEVVLLVGVAVYGAAQDLLGHEWANEHLEPMQRAIAMFAEDDDIVDRAAPTVELGQLASAMALSSAGPAGGAVGVGLAVIGTAVKAVRWSLRLGLRKQRLPDQDERVRNLLDAVRLLIGTLQDRYQSLVLIIDGLDRVRDRSTTRSLFIDSTLLSSLECPTIIAGSIHLRRQGLAKQVIGFEPEVLANAPVLDQRDPSKPGDGIEFLLDLYRRRVSDLDGAEIPEPLLRQLAYYSGGHSREFVRLVRLVAEYAYGRDLDVADQRAIHDAIDQRRRVMETGLTQADIELLRQVARDRERRLPDDERVEKLLDDWCLLPYPNRSEWYFPHPLLMLELVPEKAG